MIDKSIGIRASIFHFLLKDKYEFFEDGLLIVINGLIHDVGHTKDLLPKWEGIITIKNERGKVLMPGFIDGHTHAVQSGVIASFGEQLLNWLEDYTFPYEKKFADKEFCKRDTDFFFKELLKNGTTTAAIYSSVHQESIQAILEKGAELNMRIIAGKTNMDRNAPKELLEDNDTTISLAKQLIDKYHKYKRLSYAITPRFAITSSSKQLKDLGKLKQSFPQMHVQTHISENKTEIETVKKLFPKRKDYLEVYEHNHLVKKNTLLGHGIHFSDSEWKRIQQSEASIVHCPLSNLFLGSGLFNLKKCQDMNIPIALGSDIGAGTSFSMLKNAAAAYQVAALKGDKPTALNLFYILTLGGAKALGFEHKIGNFKIGKEADFILLDLTKQDILTKKMKTSKSIEEKLFALMMLGDDRNIDSVYLMGEQLKKY